MRRPRVYVAHPISGDVENNIERIKKTCRILVSMEIDPVVPYLAAMQFLNEHDKKEREIGIEMNNSYLDRNFIDAMFICAADPTQQKKSKGIAREINLAIMNKIPIYAGFYEALALEASLRSAGDKLQTKLGYGRSQFSHERLIV